MFSINFERIMKGALEEHHGTVIIDGRIITIFWLADVTDGLAVEGQEHANLVNCLNKTSSRYGMEISAEKTKLMTKKHKASREDDNSGHDLETMNQFMSLGAHLSEEGSKKKVIARVAQTAAVLAKLKAKYAIICHS